MKSSRHNHQRPVTMLLAVTCCIAVVVAACGAPDPNLSRAAGPGENPSGHILLAEKGDIYLWSDGSTKKLTRFGDASYPRWSNDGKQFIFVRSGDAFSDLWVANADGSNPRQLTHDQPNGQIGTAAYVCNAVWALDPAWSPVNDTIAFVSDLGTTCPGTRPNYLWLMSGLGNNPTRVPASTDNGDNVEHPSFSPDGRQVVFAQRVTGSSDLNRTTQLWKVNLDNGKLDLVAKGNQGAYDPAWSPNGKWISYVERSGAANDLWLIPASGGQPVQLTTVGNVAAPVWTPDSSAIGFYVTSGLGFKAEYVSLTIGPDGTAKSDKPQELFSEDNIDAVSGMSWAP